MMDVTFRSLKEDKPAAASRAIFASGWPGWREWLRARREADAPDLRESQAALQAHMPEMVPLWERFCEAVGADEEVRTFLTFWSPPRYLGGCSQMALGGENPVLIRNYDLDPRLNEATALMTRWGERRVIGMAEAIFGLADGINDEGLAISLAYGGRTISGRGFGVPMAVRYVLETCGDVKQGVEALSAIPHHMSYNLTLVDKAGARATVMVAPDRKPVISARPFAVNHQAKVENEPHAAFSKTRERAAHLKTLLGADGAALGRAFHEAPIRAERFTEGFGTVYTARYEPKVGALTLEWPGVEPLTASFEAFKEQTRAVKYRRILDRAAGAAPVEGGEIDWSTAWVEYVPEGVRKLLGMEAPARV